MGDNGVMSNCGSDARTSKLIIDTDPGIGLFSLIIFVSLFVKVNCSGYF